MADSEDKEQIELDNLDDIEIELTESHAVEPSYKERPQNLEWLGRKLKSTKNLAYFSADTILSIWNHCKSVKNREVGGILVGKVHKDEDDYFALVYGSIQAKDATERVASLTFTHDSWGHMLKEMDQKYPGSVVIGWYHTHPGYGIFLSGSDQHIHKNFFKLHYQIALVIDPLTGNFGLFKWNQNNIQKLLGFPIYGDENYIRKALNLVNRYTKPVLRPGEIRVDSTETTSRRSPVEQRNLQKLYGANIPSEISISGVQIQIACKDFDDFSIKFSGKMSPHLKKIFQSLFEPDKDDDDKPEKPTIDVKV